MEITFLNGRMSVEAGLSAVGSRLLYLLDSDFSSTPWKLLERKHNLAPEEEEEAVFMQVTQLDREGFLSLLEMDQCPDETLFTSGNLINRCCFIAAS